MGKMMYKDRPGGYITMPVVVTKKHDLTIEEKLVLCFIMGFWINKGDSSFSIGYISESLGIEIPSVKNAMNKLLACGLLKVSNKRTTDTGDTTFTVTMDVSAVNGFFGCELIGINEANGKTSTSVQPVRKQVMKLGDPLAWMNTEYFRKTREECQR